MKKTKSVITVPKDKKNNLEVFYYILPFCAWVRKTISLEVPPCPQDYTVNNVLFKLDS